MLEQVGMEEGQRCLPAEDNVSRGRQDAGRGVNEDESCESVDNARRVLIVYEGPSILPLQRLTGICA